MNGKMILAMSSTLILASHHAFAGGMLDFADPCVNAQHTFDSSTAAALYHADQVIQEWDTRVEPPGELRGIYVEAIREGAFKAWSDDPGTQAIVGVLKSKEPKLDVHALFMSQIYPKVMTPEKESEYVRDLYAVDYQGKIRPQLLKSRADLQTQISTQKSTMDASCKPDVVSQVFRATFGNAISLVGSNWEAAKNERGEAAKYFRATSGISITDIQKYGIQGGPGSEMNKMLGGENSAARQVIAALDPTKWKIPTPNLPVPQLPKLPAPPPLPSVTIPGTNTRVCVPWC